MQLSYAAKALEFLMSVEEDKGAKEGLAYEIAASLKAEAEEGNRDALQNLPLLKRAILNYAVEHAEEAGYEAY